MSQWPRPPVAERRDVDGRQTRLGYILRRSGVDRHCSVVSRICIARGGRQGEAATVISASRDGTLKCWDVAAQESASASAPPVSLRCSLEEHTAWVNDCVVLPPTTASADASRDSRRVVSASNDNLVKVWRVDEEKQGAGVTGALLSLRYHVDYVQCLAYAPQRTLLASAGLDSRVVVADVEAATRILSVNAGDAEDPYGGAAGHRPSSNAAAHRGSAAAQRCTVGSFSGTGQYIPQLLASPHASSRGGADSQGGEDDSGGGRALGASVWSLATTRNASLLVCGTASCAVRGWDPRSGMKLWRLRGHTENVRALVLSEDGTICISGSADRTVRVWDVGMRRCIHVFDAHHDSVWAVAMAGYSCGFAQSGEGGGAGGMPSEVFSGGRDGSVLVHDLRVMQTGLVVRMPSQLQALAVPVDATQIWASASDSHIRRHDVPSSLVACGNHTQQGLDAVPPPGAAPAPLPTLPPPVGNEGILLPGTPRLLDFRVLHNKRHVLVRDACNQVSLWDVTSGQLSDFPSTASVASASKGAEDLMRRALMQLNKPVSVPTWFNCDLSLGSLSVYLDASQCFKAETDDVDVGALPGGSTAVAGARSSAARGESSASATPMNLGSRTLRALFESWVRLPAGGLPQNARQASRNTSGSPSRDGRSQSAGPRVFVQPPALPEPASGGAQRWNDEQPPGTPSGDQTAGIESGAAAEPPTGGSAPSSFPPATSIIFMGRNGRATGYRGRLFCGLFNGVETPELLPPWVVDVVWNQRQPAEEFCGERQLMFSVVRCPSEIALPALPSPYCIAAPRTRVRRLMGYLVRVLDFDGSTPAKAAVRRTSSAVSLVSRLGRCCTVPSSRSRAGSDSLNGSQDGDDSSGGSRERSTSRRGRSPGTASPGQRRSFGLRRNEEEAGAPGAVANRVRIDGSPTRLPSVPAQAAPSGRRGEATGGAPPDEGCVEILCNGLAVDPEMSLATVRDFIWKKSNAELVLQYRRAVRVAMLSPPPPPPLLAGGGAAPTGTSTASGAPMQEVMASDVSGTGASLVGGAEPGATAKE